MGGHPFNQIASGIWQSSHLTLPRADQPHNATEYGNKGKQVAYALDEETALTRLGGGCYSRAVTDVFWNMDSAFGGWSLALAMEAVKAEADPESGAFQHHCNFHRRDWQGRGFRLCSDTEPAAANWFLPR
jgi:hypothetical protein